MAGKCPDPILITRKCVLQVNRDLKKRSLLFLRQAVEGSWLKEISIISNKGQTAISGKNLE
jgi:hypothetical protein